MERTSFSQLYQHYQAMDGNRVSVCGWVRTIRNSKMIGFIELNDGSCFRGVQIVAEETRVVNFKEILSCNVGTALTICGTLVLTPQSRQPFEIHADEIEIVAPSSPQYPLQKKRHTFEYLRTISHLRPRANAFNAAFRVRSVAAYAIHKFFQERDFLYAHTPILTASDAEGAGEMFRVTTLDPKNPPLLEDGSVDFSKDFFGSPASLTVSGQLEAEAMALAFGKVYTFGPTFRAEHSNTTRHAAEFWMVEPEIAFADLQDDMTLAWDMIQFVVQYVLEHCPQDLEFFNQRIDQQLLERLNQLTASDVEQVSYTEAVEILKKHASKFEYPIVWGMDLQTEHERFLTEKVYCKPVFVTDYPKEIKAFYMRQNDDNKTVAAMDLLVPGVGEMIGGSQREERLELLQTRMKELSMELSDYDWYLDLRRFGGVEHAGFGLGFERLIMYLTGMQNIRDVIPFPRTTGTISF